MQKWVKTILLASLVGGSALSSSGTGYAERVHGGRSCLARMPLPSAIGLPEIRGSTTQGELWALLFYRPPAPARADLKIVFRVTGSGPLRVRAVGLHGEIIHPMWGPEAHGGSNWIRPGDEWGTGWRFPVAGCWRLHAERQHESGDVWLDVVPRRQTG